MGFFRVRGFSEFSRSDSRLSLVTVTNLSDFLCGVSNCVGLTSIKSKFICVRKLPVTDRGRVNDHLQSKSQRPTQLQMSEFLVLFFNRSISLFKVPPSTRRSGNVGPNMEVHPWRNPSVNNSHLAVSITTKYSVQVNFTSHFPPNNDSIQQSRCVIYSSALF